MLIATAGHIDHGKTSLVRALSGVETDRLPEEKARGISIDLGFAYWRPDNGPTIGFVDVPGHERFVRNMIAGLSGINFALLVVAADDGVMPQTIEHLQILDLLGIRRGLVAITKVDRVDPTQVEQTREEVAALLAPTSLAHAPVLAVSTYTGEGMADLAEAILLSRDSQSPDESHGFRLAIDRAFSVAGAGTVVTGTVVAGGAATGETLSLPVKGHEVRIRGMQSGGRKVERIGRGERCAINLGGIEVDEVSRGDWLTSPVAPAIGNRIEARFALMPGCRLPLRHDSRVHFHHGAAAIGARILLPRQKSLAPGGDAVVQLILDSPTSAVAGDRFILRDQSAQETLGGGTILDPLATDRRRKLEVREAFGRAMALETPAEKLAALASSPGMEPDVRWLASACNLTDAAMAQVLAQADVVLSGKDQAIAIATSRFDHLKDALIASLARHHQEHPGEGGMPRRAARSALGEPVSAELFAGLLASLVAERRVAADRALLRLPGHSASFSKPEEDLWRRLLAACDGGQLQPLTLSEIAREVGIAEAALAAMLQRRCVNGDLWKITSTRFMLPHQVSTLVGMAARLDAASDQGFSAAQFRDASGIGRNFVIQLLEFFDRIGVTRRMGEHRRMRPDWQAVVGAVQD